MTAQGPPSAAPLIASFTLTRDQIEEIKGTATVHGALYLSAFVAAAALAWVCLLRSRSVGGEGTARSHMLFSTECRSRLAPPLPAEYFGNCLRPCFVEAATDELKGDTGGSVAAAAAEAVAAAEVGRSGGGAGVYKGVREGPDLGNGLCGGGPSSDSGRSPAAAQDDGDGGALGLGLASAGPAQLNLF